MNDDEAVRLLHDAVAIPSVSGEEEELVRFLVRHARSMGLESWRDEVGNFVAEAGVGSGSAPHVALVGHVDTVPGVIPVRIEGRRLFGRGSVDAKGALIAFLVAAARTVGDPAAPRITVVGCVEEEVASSRGARALLDRPAPDALVVGEPSGWDRVTLGYKGHLSASLTVDRPCGHGAHQEESAAQRATTAWTRLEAAASRLNADRERLFDQLLLRLDGLESGSDGLAEWARIRVSLRLPPDLGPAEAARWLRATVLDGRLQTVPGIPAWRGPRTSSLARAFGRAISEEGTRPGYQVKTGTADLNLLAPAWGCPAVAYGPGDASLDHTPREALDLDEFQRGLRVLGRVLGTAGAVAVGSGSRSEAVAAYDARSPPPSQE